MTNRADLINEFLADFNASSERFIAEGPVADSKTEKKLAELQGQNIQIVNLIAKISLTLPN